MSPNTVPRLLCLVTGINSSHICLLVDGSEWRQRIEREAEHFLDVSAWSVSDIAGKISADQIQVAINLNGYTKGARNEIFALLPAPVQTSYMGFPATTGTLLGPPCSYLLHSIYVSTPVVSCRFSQSGHELSLVLSVAHRSCK